MHLTADRISKRFGGLRALDEVSLEARTGEVTAVIGPNGAGKSTLLGCLAGMIPIDSGRILIDGAAARLRGPADLIPLGFTRTFQNIRLFEGLTAREHLDLARRSRERISGKGSAPDAMSLLRRVSLDDRAGALPAELSYGERRRLEIARGLATTPRLFLIDEPAAGATLSEQRAMADLIRSIAEDGIAVILVEHHMDLVARASKRVVVLNFGRVLTTGTIETIRQDPAVVAAYLGTTA
ncbi:MAG: ABC transporter ATP-binding protein [Acetobacteraceae bacterium]|nr:ABC transporter ATP-binding protein [Pseudomonadota bacterium]